MQKTLTVCGKTFTGKQISKLFDENHMTKGEDYVVNLNGFRYLGNYRQVQDNFFAPVCSKDEANAIAVSLLDEYHENILIIL